MIRDGNAAREIESLCLRVAEEARREALEEAANKIHNMWDENHPDYSDYYGLESAEEAVRSFIKEGK